MILDRASVESVVGRVLAATRADDLGVALEGGRRTYLRYANNQVTTSGTDVDHTLTVTATFGTRSATAEVNQLDDAAIAEVVARAEALARVAPDDPEHVPTLGPTTHPAVEAFVPGEPEALGRGIARCLAAGRADRLVASGFGLHTERFAAVASKHGLFGYHTSTAARIAQTVRTPDGGGSGWAARAAGRPDDLDYDGLSEVSRDKARRSVGARTVAPEAWPAILEPECVADLVSHLTTGLDARQAEEGRSFLARPGGGTRVGEVLFPSWIRIRSEPGHPTCPGSPWGEGGLAHQPRTWIEGGAIRTLSRDRFWAAKTGAEPVPRGDTLFMDGGEGTVADLVASTERGVLVTSLWYIRAVDPRTLLYTGLTRDGVFWVEDGEIAHPLTNYRWNDGPLSVLTHAERASAPVRVAGRAGLGRTVVPALRVSRFGFSTVSDAI